MALSFGLATALLHAPSIIHEGRLSFHEKPTGRAATWVQANYLGLMQGDRTRPSWEEVEGYLDRYGAEALPEGVLEAVTFNWAVTARSVGMRLSESAKPFVRHTGLLAGVFAIFGLMGLLRRSLPPWYIDFAILLAAFGICLSAVAFTGIQFRWYIVFPFMVTVCGVKILQEWEAPRGVGLAILAVNLILLGAANALLVGIW